MKGTLSGPIQTKSWSAEEMSFGARLVGPRGQWGLGDWVFKVAGYLRVGGAVFLRVRGSADDGTE